MNDKQITDHYAIVPTGQGLQSLGSVSDMSRKIYDCIVRRFLSIFYPPAVYQKISIVTKIKEESFFSSFKVLAEEGYLKVAGIPQAKKVAKGDEEAEGGDRQNVDSALFQAVQGIRKGAVLPVDGLEIREGETTPPKRYNSGSMILAMENAGQLIEDEELRAQIKGSGIGNIQYLALNKKSQIITPTLQGEMVYDVVDHSIRSLLNPELTASWEKGLSYVAEGEITPEEYMQKLSHFIFSRTDVVKNLRNQFQLKACYDQAARFYEKN